MFTSEKKDFCKKDKSFLNQRRNLREPYRNSCYICSSDVHLVAPVKAKHALYWTDSSFPWKDLLDA